MFQVKAKGRKTTWESSGFICWWFRVFAARGGCENPVKQRLVHYNLNLRRAKTQYYNSVYSGPLYGKRQ